MRLRGKLVIGLILWHPPFYKIGPGYQFLLLNVHLIISFTHIGKDLTTIKSATSVDSLPTTAFMSTPTSNEPWTTPKEVLSTTKSSLTKGAF